MSQIEQRITAVCQGSFRRSEGLSRIVLVVLWLQYNIICLILFDAENTNFEKFQNFYLCIDHDVHPINNI